jgi:hypothetical protein
MQSDEPTPSPEARLIAFLSARYAEDWSAARDLELASGLNGSRGTRDVDGKRRILVFLGSIPLPEVSGPVLGWLASVYSDHPDFDPEWKP